MSDVCQVCGRPVKAGRRFCSMGSRAAPGCADEAMVARSLAFADATSKAAGKPPDGVTYGAGKSAR
jgi:hypothetical protein